MKTAPRGGIVQLGHSMLRIIHTFVEADKDANVFMAKWDIKDGFWRLDCNEGKEYNFAYVLPHEEEPPTKIVIPTTLEMGWIESPSVFESSIEGGEGYGGAVHGIASGNLARPQVCGTCGTGGGF